MPPSKPIEDTKVSDWTDLTGDFVALVKLPEKSSPWVGYTLLDTQRKYDDALHRIQESSHPLRRQPGTNFRREDASCWSNPFQTREPDLQRLLPVSKNSR